MTAKDETFFFFLPHPQCKTPRGPFWLQRSRRRRVSYKHSSPLNRSSSRGIAIGRLSRLEIVSLFDSSESASSPLSSSHLLSSPLISSPLLSAPLVLSCDSLPAGDYISPPPPLLFPLPPTNPPLCWKPVIVLLVVFVWTSSQRGDRRRRRRRREEEEETPRRRLLCVSVRAQCRLLSESSSAPPSLTAGRKLLCKIQDHFLSGLMLMSSAA